MTGMPSIKGNFRHGMGPRTGEDFPFDQAQGRQSRSNWGSGPMLGSVRSADEPQDGADERAEHGRPTRASLALGWAMNHLTPACSIGKNLGDGR